MNKPKPRRGVAGLFTEVRGIGILRTSQVKHSRKLRLLGHARM
jgi:hypothetical protein